MKKKYDVAVFIGRFQPFHNGHLSVVLKAKEIADTVLIIVGSVDKPRTYKNPFSFDERKEMIEKSLRYPHGIEVGKDLVIRGNVDTIYNDTAWATRIQEIVSDTTQRNNVCLIGHKKDDSSYYLDMFPQWHLEEVEAEEYGLSATEIREKYFSEEGLFSGVKVDDQKFAMKASAVFDRSRGEWIGIAKDPITDFGKKSKQGRVTCYFDEFNGSYYSDIEHTDKRDALVTVYHNGFPQSQSTFAEIRARSNKK